MIQIIRDVGEVGCMRDFNMLVNKDYYKRLIIIRIHKAKTLVKWILNNLKKRDVYLKLDILKKMDVQTKN